MPLHLRSIHPDAPAQPDWGAACNGCGVCCLLEPCPIGRWLSGRAHGACDALVWNATLACYRCAALSEPQTVLARLRPRWGRWRHAWAVIVLRRWAARWIAAGQGCDCAARRINPDSPARAPFERTDGP